MAGQQTTASRVRAILRTQFPPRWGPRYIAAQLSTRAQAPRSSKPSDSYSDKLQRRLHFMSTGESGLGPLALMHPCLFELKTQVALCPKPQDHPLVGHPFARGLALPTTTGTAKAAERLGLLSQHPKTTEKLKDGSSQWIPVPLVHDLLLFLKDERGPYCVLWDVKRHRGDHGKPWQGDWVESTKLIEVESQEHGNAALASLDELELIETERKAATAGRRPKNRVEVLAAQSKFHEETGKEWHSNKTKSGQYKKTKSGQDEVRRLKALA